MPILLGEYRNQHSRRRYPFADEATLTDADGQILPTDFLIDAHMYPIDLENSLYMSRIELTEAKIYFADTVTNAVHGVAEVDFDERVAYVYQDDAYARQIGILTFGDGLVGLFRGRETRTFEAAATPLCPTAYIPLNQEGVRGIIPDDDTLITGAVKVEGRNGVLVTSRIESGRHILRIDILGEPGPLPDECGDDCPMIEELCVERMPGSLFTISQYDTFTVAVSGYGFDLDDICSAQKARKLPDENGELPLRPKPGCDPCGPPPVPPTPPAPGPHEEICIRAEDGSGSIWLTTPSTASMINAIGITSIDNVGLQNLPRLNFPRAVRGFSDVMGQVDDFVRPPQLAEGLAIFLKGLAIYRRKTK